MIVSLRGALIEKTNDGAVVEAAGVGHFVSLTPSALARMPPAGEEVFLYVVESVAMYGGGTALYGFLRAEERQIFNVFRDNIPGTGAKKALEMLEKAAKSLPDFRRAVLEKDVKVLVTLFGFTLKTAEKIAAALQGKLEALPLGRGPALGRAAASVDETIQGLVSLGYRDASARDAAQKALAALGGAADSRQLIREALRHLSGRA
jgi:Holliday junction resolvasome RuvABC DNA-binding subunit